MFYYFFQAPPTDDMPFLSKFLDVQVEESIIDTQNLYLANLEGKYAFPLTSIIGLQTIKKRISINGWNKEEAYNKGIYKKYKLTTNDYGSVFCKYYHILEIDYQGETLGIYIPCYEAPVFEELIKEKA